ncbi:MAG: threonine--tRNA ligase [Clostridia bacterium]|jgi:threonyl-tRNA synthetase|nr:threonine--tRNA ligase [Clostridia bacterium]
MSIKKEINLKLEISRHSMAHVLAKAIMSLYPDTKLTIGPAVDDGFYYDLDLNHVIVPEDFVAIEKTMSAIINKSEAFKRNELSRNDALKLFEDNPYKMELISDLPENEVISVYYLGDDFVDLCRGPHVENTSKLQNMGFKVNRISGAYWRGSEKNKMLQRIYVYAFASKKELSDYVLMLEEAKKRDHRKLGKELGLFFISDYGPGMPTYMPNGMIIKNELVKYWREMHKLAGYEEIETPIALNKELWLTSGHWDHYKNNMYMFNVEGEEFAIKPMNCPGGMLYYKESIHSYKDLPLRVGELGKVHRHEASGTLHGLFRVRAFTQDDAHIFMLPAQVEQEVKGVLDLVDKMYDTFGLSYHLELSTMPENHIGDIKDWEFAENELKNALINIGKEFVINEGDGAFYGPKIDIHIKDAIGRTWQCGTIQLDMQMPKRFGLEYIDVDGSKKEPLMIHRVIYGSIDRFIGIIIENYAGAFPVWLSPVQAKVLSITERNATYANEIKAKLDEQGIRALSDNRSEKLGYKVREAQIKKVPYMIVVGDKEQDEHTISLRTRGQEGLINMSLDEFITKIKEQIQSRKD